jgi:ribosomal protein L35AE/L33A
MPVVRVEHAVPDFERWKAAFDSDPIDRVRSGVRSYRVSRPVDDSKYAMVDLEFDTLDEAESFLAALRNLWSRVEGTVVTSPQVRILEVIERKEY